MPCNYKDYPKDWFTNIRPRILERAGHRCEVCGVPNKAVGYREDGVFKIIDPAFKEVSENHGYKVIQIVLTISHLNHDIQDNRDENLKAMCQRCHNRHDKDYRAANRVKNKRKNQRSLF